MPPKYHKRAHAIAKRIQKSWSICYKQAYQLAWEEDAILIMAKNLAKT